MAGSVLYGWFLSFFVRAFSRAHWWPRKLTSFPPHLSAQISGHRGANFGGLSPMIPCVIFSSIERRRRCRNHPRYALLLMRFTAYLAVSYLIIFGIVSLVNKICRMSISIGAALGLALRKVVPTGDMGDFHLTCLAPVEKSQNPRC